MLYSIPIFSCDSRIPVGGSLWRVHFHRVEVCRIKKVRFAKNSHRDRRSLLCFSVLGVLGLEWHGFILLCSLMDLENVHHFIYCGDLVSYFGSLTSQNDIGFPDRVLS
jgi:hypothetical protein